MTCRYRWSFPGSSKSDCHPADPALAGRENIVTGPTAPGFFTPDLLAVLNEKFGLRSVTTVEEDMKQLLARKE